MRVDHLKKIKLSLSTNQKAGKGAVFIIGMLVVAFIILYI